MKAHSEVSHKGTATVVFIITTLRTHHGWMSTTAVADLTKTHRDTVRRMLAELDQHGWVEHRVNDGADFWALGPELPRIGLDFQRRLAAQAAELQRLFAASNKPFESEGA